MQAVIDIDPKLFQKAEELARRKGQAFSLFVEQALLKTLANETEDASEVQLYGEPLTDEDIAEAARVTFALLDEDETRAQSR